MTLTDELFNLIARLDEARIDYAVCGGLAMAMLGHARATQDLDLLMNEDDIPRAAAMALEQGYTIVPGWMRFGEGAIKIYRVTKIDPEHHDVIPLDLLAVTPAIQSVWADRRQVRTQRGPVWVVSPAGLIAMKKLSGRKQDMADIESLEDCDEIG